ncbi:helix-turn-helix domain-containing protein [Bartonella apihabitans]
MGVHSSYISSFENGHQNPRITTLVKLADGLGVCYVDFLDPNGQA